MSERKAEPKPDVLERLRRMLEAGGIANPRHREKVADAIAEIERLTEMRYEYESAVDQIERLTAQLREYTEAKPVGYVVARIFGPGDFHPICWAHTLEEAERLKRRQMRQNQRGESSYRIQAVVALKAESDGA